MKRSLFILLLFIYCNACINAQEYYKYLALFNKTLKRSVEYEINEDFGFNKNYWLYLDTATNIDGGFFVMGTHSDCGYTYGKGSFKTDGENYVLKYDKCFNDTVIYEYDSYLSSDSLYIFFCDYYGNYLEENYCVSGGFYDTITGDYKSYFSLPEREEKDFEGVANDVYYYAIAKWKIKNKIIRLTQSIGGLSNKVIPPDNMNVVKIIENNMGSAHKSDRGEILEIKDGKLIKIVPYENKE